MKNIVISFCLGFLLALGIGFADAGQTYKTLIDSLNKSELKNIIHMMIDDNAKLLGECYKDKEQFDAKSCEPALKKFKEKVKIMYEDLYFP